MNVKGINIPPRRNISVVYDVEEFDQRTVEEKDCKSPQGKGRLSQGPDECRKFHWASLRLDTACESEVCKQQERQDQEGTAANGPAEADSREQIDDQDWEDQSAEG
jgi:hypothetical protein